MQGGGNSGTVTQTEYFGYFHLTNAHNDSENREAWDKMYINNSNFGRDVLHCIHSQNFNPWSVMERFPYDQGEMDLYLIFACGAEFLLSAASLKLELVQYAGSEHKPQVEQRFQVIHQIPLELAGEAAQGYQKRKITTFNLQPPAAQGGANTFLAFRLTIEASVDNPGGHVPMMRDFFLEGFTIHKSRQGGGFVRKEPKNCIIF